MKKRVTLLLCLSVLLCALALPTRGASTTVYLLAVNNKFCDLPGGALPVAANGVVYVPYSTFDSSVTGVDLGVSCSMDQTHGPVLTLTSSAGSLVFTVNMGVCRDGQGNAMNFHAIKRATAGGALIPYVPASAVCRFLGLQYSFLPTAELGTLIRITSAGNVMSDSLFLASSTNAMSYRYNLVMQSLNPPAPSPSATAAPSASPSVTQPPAVSPPPGGGKENVRVYLAVDASQAEGDLTAAAPAGGEMVFLFTPDSLPAQAALVRKAVAAGCPVGLTVTGTMEEIRAQLRVGNDLLTHIARVRTHIVSAPASAVETLSAEGWACWRTNASGGDANAVLTALGAKRTVGYASLPANTGAIRRVVSQVREEGYDLRRPLETELR